MVFAPSLLVLQRFALCSSTLQMPGCLLLPYSLACPLNAKEAAFQQRGLLHHEPVDVALLQAMHSKLEMGQCKFPRWNGYMATGMQSPLDHRRARWLCREGGSAQAQ